MEINKARFYNVIYETTFDDHARYNIGTYKEKKLHIILKKYFEPDVTCHEIPINGFIADICRDNAITEIETSGFSGLRPKLAAYLPSYKVTLVHPLAAKRYVSWIDPETNEISKKRLASKKENAYDVLFEMVRILPHLKDPNLTILAPMLEVDDYRLLNGWSRDRKKGSTRYERVPVDLFEILEFSTDDDFRRYIPDTCGDTFTVSDFRRGSRLTDRAARAIIKVMEARGVVAFVEKRGKSKVYKRI